MVAMRIRRLALVLPAALVAGGCASTTPVAGAGGGVQAGSAQRWSAQLRQPSLSASGTLRSSTTTGGSTATSYGSVSFMPVVDSRGRMRYELSVTAPTLGGSQVAWAIHTGECRTPSPPVVPLSELPVIDLATSGTGVVRGELPMQLEPRTTYHVNVYSTPRATDVNNVMLCGKLGYSGPK